MIKNKKLNIWDINTFKKNIFITTTPKQTRNLGEKFAVVLKKGDIVLLKGGLGSGKTTFTQGVVRAFRNKGFANSASFTLVNEYNANGATRLFHMDLYRLQPSNVWDIGIEEYLYSDNISLIEWPDRLVGIENYSQWNIEIENIGLERKIKIDKIK
ncbi:MAG: tRNA (adenosine(37)-N6)-threonylcarbamoyltransferase complex ATPase subunit type 1 TsaE [Endomicrobium sp.]|jgi:tRNA threonylcarbamoyladenosine biosynthesis protein TsaE|nr:tRNA (adenosine(37)-N6)-threonylcarbamoyltransferase complex ATPase subunit type 1 TsaE [Endomicrobium sp.]